MLRTIDRETRIETLKNARDFLIKDMDRAVKEYRTTTEDENQKIALLDLEIKRLQGGK
jgi:hypothetical protein